MRVVVVKSDCFTCRWMMPVGAVLLVIATDPGIETDMPLWCRATRHEHLATFRDGTSWKSYVRKRGRAAPPSP